MPSLPGVWPTLDRKSPTIFKSPDPPGSPFWYPDTPINYAILYHWGGYNVHDAWWRADYGPGTQFPHTDSGGDQTFAGNGSHGCINMQEDQAAWVYNHTDWNTTIMVY
jgi:lipoprotein-anchoring transpeptidase ErfK/SrfK